jgi:hypothetical protein
VRCTTHYGGCAAPSGWLRLMVVNLNLATSAVTHVILYLTLLLSREYSPGAHNFKKKLRDHKFISQTLTTFQAKSTNRRRENRA